MATFAIETSDTVLMLLRRLPPLDRLRVVAQALPELERELTPDSAAFDFWHGASMQALVAQQNVRPADDLDALLGGWPPDESIDDFVQAVRESRQRYLAEVKAE